MRRKRATKFECAQGETVTMNFEPSDDGIVTIKFRTDQDEDFSPLDGFELQQTIGNEQLTIEVQYIFFAGAQGNCRIFLEGSEGGGRFENRPPATDRPGAPEQRTYRFLLES
jgi:hypothetical protein